MYTWVWDQHWVLLDHVLWELVGLVGGQALAGNGLLHNLPEWADLGRGLDLSTYKKKSIRFNFHVQNIFMILKFSEDST